MYQDNGRILFVRVVYLFFNYLLRILFISMVIMIIKFKYEQQKIDLNYSMVDLVICQIFCYFNIC